tara:strand:- start:8475 stop:8954 length:480 start_codon:yes stop_codon:yes gene_type:complete
MNRCSLYIATFCVTALWDVALNYITRVSERLPRLIKEMFPFIGYLVPYFKKHTVLAAALIAGFIGATTQMIITQLMRFPLLPTSPVTLIAFLVVSFAVSALYGFLMKFSGLFPILEATYYKRLEANGGVIRSMYHDGVSGLIVQCTLLVLYAVFPALTK